MLHGDTTISVTFIVFDLLAIDGASTIDRTYHERRALLEQLDLSAPPLAAVDTFGDGQALFAAVFEQGLEGVVAKRERDPYRPGERRWVKTKNRATARFAEELAGATRHLRH